MMPVNRYMNIAEAAGVDADKTASGGRAHAMPLQQSSGASFRVSTPAALAVPGAAGDTVGAISAAGRSKGARMVVAG